MQIVAVRPSSDDSCCRYDFKTKDGYIEIMKLKNEESDRVIVCVPSSYGCGLGCTFCHLTKAGSKSNAPVSSDTILKALRLINITPTLISIMGAGEPLLNLTLVTELAEKFPVSIATSLPSYSSVVHLYSSIMDTKANIKIYISIHSFMQEVRKSLMPNSVSDFERCIEELLELPKLKETEGHKSKDTDRVVIHYTLIPGVNSSFDNYKAMHSWLCSVKNPPKIKFLKWSDGDNAEESIEWKNMLLRSGFKASFHAPNGSDVGGACGQFNPEYYSAYTKDKRADLLIKSNILDSNGFYVERFFSKETINKDRARRK
jgi:adenine C2-methylase RlmN of 23S rRNA A2503 and tRNA A37